MKDIYSQAKSGNRNAVHGIYASSIASAYESVHKIIKDEKTACSIVEEAYLSAFGAGKNYDDFFAVLNKKALYSVRYYSENKSASISPIIAISTIYASISSMPIPEELKAFDSSLCSMVAVLDNPESYNISASLDKTDEADDEKDDVSLPDDLTDDEAQESDDFKSFENFKPDNRDIMSPENKLADMLSNKPTDLAQESGEKSKKSRKTHFIIIGICAFLIIAAGICAYILSKNSNSADKGKTTLPSLSTVQTTTKTYTENQSAEAFTDYLNGVLLPQYGRTAAEKTVAYDESGAVGITQINGLVSAKIYDFDKDGEKELLTVTLSAAQSGGFFTYSYLMNIYEFRDLKVTPALENYLLMDYKTQNKTDGYTLNNFNFFIRIFYRQNIPYIYTEASGVDYSMISYCSYYGESMHDGKTFLYYAWTDSSFIYLRSRDDGTYDPVYCVYSSYPVNKLSKVDKNYISELSSYGFNVSGADVECANSKSFINSFNKSFSETGLNLGFSTKISFAPSNKKDYIVNLNSTIQSEGTGKWKAIVYSKDYTSLSSLIKK